MPQKKIKKKSCFFISPIGNKGSIERKRSDTVLKHIINPVLKDSNFRNATRADELSEPGLITSQIISRIVKNSLVIADLTDHNPNVYYELAIRHVIKKPYIQIIQHDQTIPFDVAGARTIYYNLEDPDEIDNAKKELKKQINFAVKNPDKIDNPITMSLTLASLNDKKSPIEKSLLEVHDKIDELDDKLYYIDGYTSLDEISSSIDDVKDKVDDTYDKVNNL